MAKQSNSSKIKVNFLGRDKPAIKHLLSLSRLFGKVEELPKNMFTSDENPEMYSFTLELKPGNNKRAVTNILLDTWPVRSIQSIQ